jgi:CubicO group peptidase (beta-lactamase class C family)
MPPPPTSVFRLGKTTDRVLRKRRRHVRASSKHETRANGTNVTIDGSLHPDFYQVATVFRDQLGRYPGGAALCVYHRGTCVVDLWGGCRDARGAPWTRETMSPSFSTTKGVASTLLHMMVDRGLLDYDDRVAKYWPEFAQAGKQAITVRQVMAHQSGLYHIRQMIDHADRMLDWDFMIRAIERTPPIHAPGTRTGYHGLTYGFLVGEILQRVTGRPFPQLVQDELVQPLGLDGLYVGAPPEELHRAAQLIWPKRGLFAPPLLPGPDGGVWGEVVMASARWAQGWLRLAGVQFDLQSILDALAPRGISSFDFGAEKTLRAAIPAANGLFTARSLAKMYAALAGGGEIDGVRLLSSKTLARATQVQDRVHRRMVIPFDLRWRLGYHGVATTRGVPRRAFGHFGFGGSGAWAEPRRNLAVGRIVSGGLGAPFGDLRLARIGGAVLNCVKQRRLATRGAATRAHWWAALVPHT